MKPQNPNSLAQGEPQPDPAPEPEEVLALDALTQAAHRGWPTRGVTARPPADLPDSVTHNYD